MSGKIVGKAAPGTRLWNIGFWATVWWGVTGLYCLLVVWMSKNYYAELSIADPSDKVLNNWKLAFGDAYSRNILLILLTTMIIAGWVLCANLWLKELKRQKISYKAGLKDLLFTIRR